MDRERVLARGSEYLLRHRATRHVIRLGAAPDKIRSSQKVDIHPCVRLHGSSERGKPVGSSFEHPAPATRTTRPPPVAATATKRSSGKRSSPSASLVEASSGMPAIGYCRATRLTSPVTSDNRQVSPAFLALFWGCRPKPPSNPLLHEPKIGQNSSREKPRADVEKTCCAGLIRAPRAGLEPATLRLTAGCSAN
jgi:hypothetical protein